MYFYFPQGEDMKRSWAAVFGILVFVLCGGFGQSRAPASVESEIIDLRGGWHFKVYRKYEKMFQYFAYGGCPVSWEDSEAAKVPDSALFSTWETVQGPSSDYSTGGLLQMNRGQGIGSQDDRKQLADFDLFPKWSEAWWCKDISIQKGFLKEKTVTLILGIIDDNDVVYINGKPVAASGFKTKDGRPAPAQNVPALGGFAPDGDFQFEKSYWEVPREYSVPASLFHTGRNELCIRIYNNNSFGGFYDRNLAVAGTAMAARWVKGLPVQKLASSSKYAALIKKQNEALSKGDLDAYASTLSGSYHQNELDRAGAVEYYRSLLSNYERIEIVDTNGGFYTTAARAPCYTANRQVLGYKDGKPAVISSINDLVVYFSSENGKTLEKGNWSRCYTVSYTSTLPAMKSRQLSYSVYLPPSYYADTERRFPVVYLLHGINSTGRSFIDVDHIDQRMDEWIKSGKIREMIVIMPNSGKSSFYKDTEGGPNDNQGPWASHISVDILGQTDKNFRTLADRKFRGLTGISMGGAGVFSIGMANTALFSSFASHMGAVHDAVSQISVLDDKDLADLDFYLDCGLQDGMVDYRDTEATAKYLESRGAKVVWELRDGGHNSAFYMAGMLKSMQMHSAHFVRNGLD